MKLEKNKDNIFWELLAQYVAHEISEKDKLVLQEIILSEKEKKYIFDQYTRLLVSPSVDSEPENEIIVLDKIYSEIYKNNSQYNEPKRKRLRFVSVAASIVALISIGALSFYFGRYSSTTEAKEAWVEYNTLHGGYTRLVLSDSTEVFINAGSTFQYPIEFKGDERIVKLEGEAYFNVAKDQSRKFIVESENITVNVTGTSFNLKVYEDDLTVETTLETGSINVHTKGMAGFIELKPGQHFSFNPAEQIHTLKYVDTQYYTSWKDGNFAFFHMSFSEICKLMERRFGVNIEIKNKQLANKRFTGRFIYGEELYQILDLLRHNTNFGYRKEENNVLVIW